MLARDQAQKPGNLPHIGNQRWIAQARHQMRRDDLADPGQALEPGHRLPQFRILWQKCRICFCAAAAELKLKCSVPTSWSSLKRTLSEQGNSSNSLTTRADHCFSFPSSEGKGIPS